MSYDIGLYISTGKEEVLVPDTESSYTCNVSPMLKAIDWKEGIYLLNGKKAADAVLGLGLGIRKLEDSPAEYAALSPANGFGTYEDCLQWLRGILAHCEQHPLATLRIT